MKMDAIKRIKEVIENMSTSEQVDINNAYEDAINGEFQIFSMDEFDEFMEGMTPTDIAQRIFYGDFKPCDDWFQFDGYANLVSFDFLDDNRARFYPSDIAEYCARNDEDFDVDEIREILDKDEDEDEDEE